MIAKKKMIVGVDLGGSKIGAILADEDGRILARQTAKTLAEQGPEAVIQRIVQTVRQVAAGADVIGVGVGAAGALDVRRGVMTFSPNLPGWCDIPLRDILSRELDFPVYLANDATLAVLGEQRFGAGQGIENLVFVGLGTGIGGGIIIEGRLYSGTSGAAGEVGHMIIDVNGPPCKCGNNGCLETFASGTAVAAEAVKRIQAGIKTDMLRLAGGDINKVTAKTVQQAALNGDELALDIVSRTAYYLGIGLVNLVNIFNPQLILVGGGLANMGSMLLDPAIKVINERAFGLSVKALRIELAKLGEDAGVLGAVAFVLQEQA